MKRYNVSDQNLRKISISALPLLVTSEFDDNILPQSNDELPGFIYSINTEMLEYLRTIKDKYRIYIFVNIAPIILKW